MKNTSPETVAEVLNDPAVWASIDCDEMCREAYFVGEWTYLGDESAFMGFRPIGFGEQEVHIAARRKTRNIQTFAMSCLDEMRQRGTARFIAVVTDWNRAALRLARHCGFAEFHRLDGICHRDGVPHQVILMESK